MARLQELGRPIRWLREHPFAADGILAGSLVAMTLLVHVAASEIETDRYVREPTWWTVLLVAATSASIATRRRAPVTTLAVTTSLQMISELVDVEGSGWTGVLVAIYSVAVHAEARARLRAAGVVGAAIVILMIVGIIDDEVQFAEAVASMALFVAAYVVGDNMRRRREHVQSLAERADRAERDRDRLARERVSEERSRIARELHDIVAHSVSVMVLQAGAARRQLDRDPAATTELLQNIEGTGRRTMDELRQVLGVLRDGDGVASAPVPSLADLHDLVLDEAELRVSLHVEGDVDAVPSSVGLATYRIVQEALTNSRRHGGPGVVVSVRVACTPGCVEVMVDDDGRGASSTSEVANGEGGYGLVGMRERAVAAGGVLNAGPKTGGGWRVRARLPFAPSEQSIAPPVRA